MTMLYSDNFRSWPKLNYDVVLTHDQSDGKSMTRMELDQLKNWPNARTILLNNLDQQGLRYFVHHYGKRFEAIAIVNSPSLTDLSELRKLKKARCLVVSYCPKAKKLWNLARNRQLQALRLSDCAISELHEISRCRSLKHLELESLELRGFVIDSLAPLISSNLESLLWYGQSVRDGDLYVLAKGHLKTLDLSIQHFSLEGLAYYLSLFDPSLKGAITVPYTKSVLRRPDGAEKVLYFGCGHSLFEEEKDDEKRQAYLEQFESLKAAFAQKNA